MSPVNRGWHALFTTSCPPAVLSAGIRPRRKGRPTTSASMPAPQGPPPPGKKTKKEKQRERKAAAGTTAVPTTGQKVGEAASQKRRADSGSDDKPAKAAKTEEAANAGRRLFVGHCPQSLTEDGVRKLFETCGDCDVEMVQRPNGRFKGICFVTFETAKAATAALKLDGSELDGKKVVVQLASAPTGSKEEQPEAAPSPSVFVANLAAGTDKAAVRGVMREFGTIKGVTLIQKAEGHAAFVDFETTEEASKAVAAKSFARPLPAQRGQSGHQLAAAAHAAIHPPLQRPRSRAQAAPWARERARHVGAEEKMLGAALWCGPNVADCLACAQCRRLYCLSTVQAGRYAAHHLLAASRPRRGGGAGAQQQGPQSGGQGAVLCG